MSLPRPVMIVTVEVALPHQKSILRHLLELCQHDYSQYNQMEVNEHGLFDYPYLDHYWTEPGRYPFLLKCQAQIAGFALVRVIAEPDQPPLYTMAEFFVLRKYRRQGVGQTAAKAIFTQFPGRWQVCQEAENHPAQLFWHQLIAEYTQGNYTEEEPNSDEWSGPCQTFNSLSN